MTNECICTGCGNEHEVYEKHEPIQEKDIIRNEDGDEVEQ